MNNYFFIYDFIYILYFFNRNIFIALYIIFIIKIYVGFNLSPMLKKNEYQLDSRNM